MTSSSGQTMEYPLPGQTMEYPLPGHTMEYTLLGQNEDRSIEQHLEHELCELGIIPESFNDTPPLTSHKPPNIPILVADPHALAYDVQFLNARLVELPVHGIGLVSCLVSESGHIYEFIRTLRKCIYGKVKHAVRLSLYCPETTHGDQSGGRIYLRTTDEVAIKIMSKSIIERGECAENPMVELACQQYLASPGHPHVLSLVECLQDTSSIFAVMPFCAGGELFSCVETHGAFGEVQAREYFVQIVAGLSYLHLRHICHRDMSLENVLLDHGNNTKIIDFGLSVGIPVDAQGLTYALPPTGAVGKAFYMAPEIYRNDTPYNGFFSDVWSLGVMLFILVTGAPPFERPDLADPRFQMIARGKLSGMLDSWGMSHISPGVRNLLSRMLVANDPGKRIRLEDISTHQWILQQ